MGKTTLLVKLVALLILIGTTTTIQSQTTIWEKTTTKPSTQNLSKSKISIDESIFTLHADKLQNILNQLSKNGKIILSFPNAYDQFQEYSIWETHVMHPELAAKFKNIKTYTGKATDGSNKTIQFTYSKLTGVHGIITDLEEKTSIQPLGKSKHRFYNAIQEESLYDPFNCLTKELSIPHTSPKQKSTVKSVSKELKKYRLAVSVAGEYSQFFLDGTEKNDLERKTKVLTAIVTSINRINEIFKRDLGIVLELIPQTDAVIFLYPKTDPYNNWGGGGNAYGFTLQNTLNQHPDIGVMSYDVGHLFQVENNKRGNAGSVGNACIDTDKGKAYSIHKNPDSDDMNLLIAHEMGHQFGAYHVQSSFICRSGNGISEVEPGSGSSIMSYAGICPPIVQAETDGYYNYVNIRDVQTYINETATCAETITTNNTAPIANAGNNYTIPISTPFVLTGEATDIDGVASLTYNWEQNDPENPNSSASPQPDQAKGPLFRSFPPSYSPKRYFPALSHVIQGNLTPMWEVLPNISRTIDFAFTVRDNDPEGGQTSSDLTTIIVTENSGVFKVTSQNSQNIVWNQGEQATITWNVGKTNQAPISVSHVNLLLSVDGGYTYPHVLANNTRNDGSETIIIPSLVATAQKARIMVQAVDNVFYAINQSDFKIQSSEFTLSTSNSDLDICKGEDANYAVQYKTFLDFNDTVTFSAKNLPAGTTVAFTPTTITGKQLVEKEVKATITNTVGLAIGSYNITLVGSTATGVKKEINVTLDVYDNTITPSRLTYPSNKSYIDNLTPTLSWQNDPNASSYEYQLATDINFNTIIEQQTITQSNVTVSPLQYNTEYFWRVKKSNSCQSGIYTPYFSFNTRCSIPKDFRVNNIGYDYISVNWADDSNTSWELEYGPKGFAIGTGTIKTSNTTSTRITGLSKLSTYDLYLRSTCDTGNTSNLLALFQIQTLGDYCNGDRFYDSGGLNDNYSNRENQVIVLIPDSNDQRIRLDFNQVDLEIYHDWLKIYDGPDINARLITSISGTTIPPSIVSTHESGKLTVQFSSDETTTSAGWDATVTCETKPSCRFPDTVTFNDHSSNSVLVNWAAQDTVESWELEYGEKDFIPGEGTTIITNTNSYTISDLDQYTQYDVYITAKCKDGGFSDSMPVPFSFKTLCGSSIAPFNEFFALQNDELPDCWTSSGVPDWTVDFSTGGASSSAGDHTPGGFTRYASVFGNHIAPIDQTTSVSTLESPYIDISDLEKPSIGFALFNEVFTGERHSKIVVSFFDGNQWNILLTQQERSKRWTTYVFDISEYTITEAIKIKFEVTRYQENGSYYGSGDILIDDIFVGVAPDYCSSGHFYDSGGPAYNYKDQEHRITVLEPMDEQSRVRLIFDSFDIAACCSTMSIYDGPDTNAPLIGMYTDTAPPEIVSTHKSGKLTVLFVSNSSVTVKSGWDARVICEPKPICQSPDSISFTEITPYNVKASWASSQNNSEWQILYAISGDTGIKKAVQSASNEVTLENLVPDTVYDVFIKSMCIGNTGDLKGPYSFRTLKENNIEPNPTEDGFSYYPNPVLDKLFIESSTPIVEVKIAQISGQIIATKKYNINAVTVPLENLSQGLYFITVYTNTTKKIVKVLKK